MSNASAGFEGCLFHPDLGNEMAPGIITADPRTLRFQSEAMTVEMPLERVVVEFDRRNNGRICFSDPGQPGLRYFTPDESILSHWALVQSNHVRPQLKKIAGRNDMSRRLKLTLYAFLACGLIAWVGSFVVGAMVRLVVKQIPAEWEKQLGDKHMVTLREELEFLDDTNREAQLTLLAAPLTRAISGRTVFKFYIVASPLPNAAALPGGHVVVTTSLLDMVDRPEQLLGVIAHEVAHVTRRHSFQQVISGAGPLLILQILLSDRNNRLNLVAELSGVLIYQSFSQSYELDADAVGWDYMVAANVDPYGMIEALRKLKAEVGDDFSGPEAFSSHPALDKRISRLEAKWAKLRRKSGFLEITNPVPKVPESDAAKHLLNVFRDHSK